MLKRRRNAGLRLNSTGERGSIVNNSASIISNNASARRGKTSSSLRRKVRRSCKGAVVVILLNHQQISNLVKPSWRMGSKLQEEMELPNALNGDNYKTQSIIIIGAGIAGLSAGCYGQMNGYKTRIFELHDKPGGLCTAWKRKGYTFDG